MKLLGQKYFLLLILLLFIKIKINSQQFTVLSQTNTNGYILNPAFAGYDGRTSINFLARKDYIGFYENTPQTFSFNFHTRILKSKRDVKLLSSGKRILKEPTSGRVGFGGGIFDDENSAIRRLSLNFTYAYHIFIRNSQLSFGLSGLITQFNINKEKAVLKNPEEDPLYGLIGKTTFIPDASLGINFITYKYQIGFSVSQIFQSKIKIISNNEFSGSKDVRLKRYFCVIASYNDYFKYNPQWEYNLEFILRSNDYLYSVSDFILKFNYKQEYWFGMSYRTNNTLIFHLGTKVHRLYFGYSFDYGFNTLSRYSKGSHEILVSYKIGDTARRYRWLERY